MKLKCPDYCACGGLTQYVVSYIIISADAEFAKDPDSESSPAQNCGDHGAAGIYAIQSNGLHEKEALKMARSPRPPYFHKPPLGPRSPPIKQLKPHQAGCSVSPPR